MPKVRSNLTKTEKEELLFIEWLLNKLRINGNTQIDELRSELGLTTEAGKANTSRHIGRNKNIFKNYICENLNSNEVMYRHLLEDR